VRIYLDTCIWIYAIEDPAGRGEAILAKLLESMDDTTIVYSYLTEMECLIVPRRNRDDSLIHEYFATWSLAELVPMSQAVFRRASQIRADHKVKTPDALHLAAALEFGCDEFWTNDARLSALAQSLAIRQLP
jgi:uncharacterized protein